MARPRKFPRQTRSSGRGWLGDIPPFTMLQSFQRWPSPPRKQRAWTRRSPFQSPHFLGTAWRVFRRSGGRLRWRAVSRATQALWPPKLGHVPMGLLQRCAKTGIICLPRRCLSIGSTRSAFPARPGQLFPEHRSRDITMRFEREIRQATKSCAEISPRHQPYSC